VTIRRQIAAPGMMVGPLHRLQFALDRQFFSRFEQQNLHAMRREHKRSHPSGRAGADYDRVICGS
jgi:hypothetical protein